MMTQPEIKAHPALQAAKEVTRAAMCAVKDKERDQRAERTIRSIKIPPRILDSAQETRRMWEIAMLRKRLEIARTTESLIYYEACFEMAKEAEARAKA